MNQIVLILVVVVVGGAALYLSSLMERRRREALEAAAHGLGLSFDPGPDRTLHRAFRHSIFSKGRSRRGSNTMAGMMKLAGRSIGVRMGDYRYTTGSGKNRHTHRISYAAFRLPWVNTPDLLIRREHLGDKLVGGLGFDDIDFESEEFSRSFWVKSGDKRYAYDVIHPRMMEFLLKGPTPQVEIVGDICLILEGRTRWDPDTFEGAPGWFGAFLELWPDHLTERLQPKQELPG
jgi:hypothetical protein